MRNLFGGILGAISGATLIVYLTDMLPTTLPNPFNNIWFLLVGSETLASTIEELANSGIPLVITWLIIGIIAGLFSTSKWNTIRTAAWIGACLATLSVIYTILLDSTFWISETRNIALLIHYVSTVAIAMVSLVVSVPLATIISKLKLQKDDPIPTLIETQCECGAVFKSRPMICSECGKTLTAD